MRILDAPLLHICHMCRSHTPRMCRSPYPLSLSISQLRSAPELLTTAAEIQLPAAETRITHKILYPSYMLSLIHAFFIESAGRVFPLKSIRTHAESGDTRDCMHLCGIHSVTAYMYAARMQGSAFYFCTRRVASHGIYIRPKNMQNPIRCPYRNFYFR
jgi:hypothetical protein